MNRISIPTRLRKRLVIAVISVVGLWVVFFDSHSILKRMLWYGDKVELTVENDALRKSISDLDSLNGAPLSDEAVERIAREQYGMRKSGDTIYQVEHKKK